MTTKDASSCLGYSRDEIGSTWGTLQASVLVILRVVARYMTSATGNSQHQELLDPSLRFRLSGRYDWYTHTHVFSHFISMLAIFFAEPSILWQQSSVLPRGKLSLFCHAMPLSKVLPRKSWNYKRCKITHHQKFNTVKTVESNGYQSTCYAGSWNYALLCNIIPYPLTIAYPCSQHIRPTYSLLGASHFFIRRHL